MIPFPLKVYDPKNREWELYNMEQIIEVFRMARHQGGSVDSPVFDDLPFNMPKDALHRIVIKWTEMWDHINQTQAAREAEHPIKHGDLTRWSQDLYQFGIEVRKRLCTTHNELLQWYLQMRANCYQPVKRIDLFAFKNVDTDQMVELYARLAIKPDRAHHAPSKLDKYFNRDEVVVIETICKQRLMGVSHDLRSVLTRLMPGMTDEAFEVARYYINYKLKLARQRESTRKKKELAKAEHRKWKQQPLRT